MTALPDLPEDKALSTRTLPSFIDLEESSPPRRQRPKRTKQWSDGVIGMAHNPMEKELQELMELRYTTRPLRRESVNDSFLKFEIPTQMDLNQHVTEEHGQDSWRYRVIEFLHNKKVQYLFMSLLILDVLILFVEVTLMALYPSCDITVRDGISCCPVSSEGGLDEEFLPNNDQYNDVCGGDDSNGWFVQPEPDFAAGCDSHKWHTVHTIEEGLFICTMIILSCFFLELNVLLVVLQPAVFFRQLFYLLDYIIIGVSLALELFFHIMHQHLNSTMAGMLVLFRMWRYVRISHGIVGVTAELADQKFERLLNYTEHLEEILRSQGTPIPEDSKVAKLRQPKENGLVAEVRRHHAHEKRLSGHGTGKEDSPNSSNHTDTSSSDH